MAEPRRKYDREFKVEAVKLASRGDKALAQVARDLGVNSNVLTRWKRQLTSAQAGGDPNFAFPGKGRLNPFEEELRSLRKQLRDVTEQRDILKKALAIFSKTPDRNDNS